jgi:cystathionine beta-lyase
MFIADADWATAPAVVASVRRRLDGHPVFAYGHDDFGLTDNVLAWYRRKYSLEVPREWVVLIQGIVPALVNLSKLSEKGVLTTAPNYGSLLSAPARVGKRSVVSRLRENVSGTRLTYEWDYADLAEKAKSSDILYLCNPHNPIGRAYTREELARTADFARQNNLLTVSDEIHCEILLGATHTPWFSVKPENSVTLVSSGKICNMPGIPIAIAIVPDEALRARVRAALGTSTVYGGILNAAAASGAFSEECDAWKADFTAYLTKNRDWLDEQLPKRLPRARATYTEATYLQWLDLSDYALGDATKYLREHAKVQLTEGVPFGGAEHHVRINFATTRERLSEALTRIEEAVRDK